MRRERVSLLTVAVVLGLGLAGCDGDDGSDGAPGGDPDDETLSLTETGRYTSDDNGFDESAAEIVAFDAASAQAFVVNSEKGQVDILDLQDPANPTLAATLSASDQWAAAGGVNSVAVRNGLVALAVENETRTEPGRVQVYNASDRQFRDQVTVGALPDMVGFSPDGTRLVVANEGEPNADYTIDPEGSVSIIDASNPGALVAREAGFQAFNQGQSRAQEVPDGVRVFGNLGATRLPVTAVEDSEPATLTVPDASAVSPGDWLTVASNDDPIPYQVEAVSGDRLTLTSELDGDTDFDSPSDLHVTLHDGASSVAQDLEPEYIAVSPDGNRAWATLQENNAVAVVDLAQARVERLVALGTKDHGSAGNELDPSDDDGGVAMASWPVQGMYMPDTIQSARINGEVYYLTANEGDAREYDGFVEEVDFEDTTISPELLDTLDVEASLFERDEKLGELLTTIAGSNSGTAIEAPLTFGARSFSIWNAQGALVYDSASAFERITAERFGDAFNNDNDENDGDSRSDDKGPEPEALEVARIDGRSYAFIGLERMGGVMVYDISTPESPEFLQYVNNRDLAVDIESAIEDGEQPAHAAGDLGPESLMFVSADDSPSGQALLLVGNEVSGTTTVYGVR